MASTTANPQPKPTAKSHSLTGAATRSYNVASLWEQLARLTPDQESAVDVVSNFCSVRPYPTHLADDTATSEKPQIDTKDSYVGTLEDAVLQNSNQFHKWHSELEAACASETEEKYKQYAALLTQHLQSCDQILEKVDANLKLFDYLLAQHHDVSQKSKALSHSCEQLVREKEQLVEFANAIREKLKYFDEYETMFAQFQSPQFSTDNEHFLPMLQRLDECIGYVGSSPQYADSSTYLSRFRQLQIRALSMVRTKVQDVLKHSTQQVQAAVQEAAGGGPPPASNSMLRRSVSQLPPVLAEGTEVSLLYVRFRAAAEPSLKGLLKELEARQQLPEYSRVLQDCVGLYCAARQQLVAPFVQQRVQQYTSQPLPLLTRNGCDHLMRVVQLEAQLLEQFFPGCKDVGSALAPLVGPLAMVLYDTLRPLVVQLQDIDQLCDIVDILKTEVLQEQLGRRGGAVEALRPMLQRTLADVQGRLIYRCQAFIKEEVASYQPTSDDVDFPTRLERAAAAAATSAAAPDENNEIQPDDDGDRRESNGHAEPNGNSDDQNEDQYLVWYPPLRNTLLILSKLYRAVDLRTFGGLAQEALAAATLSIQQAGRQVVRRAGQLDAQLFIIRHLLFLREQIAPFNAEFASQEVDLDFSHMRTHVRHILAGKVSLFALSQKNAVVQMLGSSGPRVLRTSVDSRNELESRVKAVCEEFIMATTKLAVEPLVSFLTKVTAVRLASSANPAATQALRTQAFAAPEKVAEIVQRVNDAMRTRLPTAVAKMKLYVTNPATQSILFRPIKSSIAEAHSQIAALLDSEYTPEEAAAIPLLPPPDLAALLDSIC